jgi:eukaryotic-like serine/threonine-protein kinase
VTELDATEPGPALTSDTIVDNRREIKRCPECSQRYGPEARFCPFDGAELDAQTYDPAGDSLLGAIIDDRYEVCAVLGEGGMGTVYKVRHVSLERMFAMKVLRQDLAKDADLSARFMQEARATASIKHPNVVQITDFGRLPDGVPYFVMELLVGQPLSVVLKSRAPLPYATACQIVFKIAAGLGAAHEVGIVHRDLKPDNVFLVGRSTDSQVPDDVRVVDFGAAKVMGSSRVTKTGIVFGTPHFMSPEQASGSVVDHRADIYALGVIMYELFTGRVPFEADTYMGVLTQHMFVQPARPSTVSEHAQDLGRIEEVILRALEKKPEMRFASMDELAAAIRQSVRLGPSGEVQFVRASPSPAPPARASSAPPSLPPEPPRQGPAGWMLGLAGGAIVAAAAVATWAYLQPSRAHDPDTVSAPTTASERPPSVTISPPSASTATPAAPASAPPPASASASAALPPPSASAAPSPPRRPVRPPPTPPRKVPDPEFVDPWKKSGL